MAQLKGGTTIGGYTVTHEGNLLQQIISIDGDSSGIDADLLDGKHASDFSLSSHVHADATISVSGFLSSGDKTKLDGIASDANNYVHPTTSGNKHVPAGGSAGQFLKWSADGTAVWAADNDTIYTHPTYSYVAPVDNIGTTLSSVDFISTLAVSNGHVTGGTKRNLVAGTNISIEAQNNGDIRINATDTNTTYSAGNGISLSGTTFSVAGGDGLVQETSGLKLGTPSNVTSTSINISTGETHSHALVLPTITTGMTNFTNQSLFTTSAPSFTIGAGSPAITGINSFQNTAGLAGVKGAGGSAVGEGYLGGFINGKRAGVIGVAGDNSYSDSLAGYFEGKVEVTNSINSGQVYKYLSASTNLDTIVDDGIYKIEDAVAHSSHPTGQRGGTLIVQHLAASSVSQVYISGLYIYKRGAIWMGTWAWVYGWTEMAHAPGTITATSINSNSASTGHTHAVDLIPRIKLDDMQSSAKYVRIARMTKDIGTSSFGAQFFVFGGGSYGGTGINSDIVTISPRGTLGSTTVRAKRLDTSASVQNKYYHRVNGDYIELWMYQGTYSYDTTIELKNVSSNNSEFVFTFPYNLIQTSIPSGLVEGTYS